MMLEELNDRIRMARMLSKIRVGVCRVVDDKPLCTPAEGKLQFSDSVCLYLEGVWDHAVGREFHCLSQIPDKFEDEVRSIMADLNAVVVPLLANKIRRMLDEAYAEYPGKGRLQDAVRSIAMPVHDAMFSVDALAEIVEKKEQNDAKHGEGG